MTIEQKAKAYDKAIERAKLSRQQLLDIGEEATEIEYIFPELTESVDVKEKLIKFFQRYPYKYIADAEMFTKDAITWLEKQGEHKLAYSRENETSIAIKNPDAYRIGFADGEAHVKEEMASIWSEEDEKRLQSCISSLQGKGLMGGVDTINTKWLKSLKQRIGK